MLKIAINGFGRIGRLVLRAIIELDYKDIEVVAINGPANIDQHTHLFQFDSVHGVFRGEVRAIGEDIIQINNHKIRLLRERDISNINWGDLGVDLVMECTGAFTSLEKCKLHLDRGAKKVIISAPAKEKDIKTIVFGVNQQILSAKDEIISIGSCTTNCLAPITKVMNDTVGIEKGFMTTIHAYTGDQNNVDGSHKSDLRRARACATSMIPTTTGAAKAIGLVIPQLEGKLDGSAIRVPVNNVSVVDLCFTSIKNTDTNEINQLLKTASEQEMRGILGYETRPLVSIDFCHDSRSSIVDALETKVKGGNFVRILSWYDNEWAFSVRMLDVAKYWFGI